MMRTLKEWRAKKDLTQFELAQKIGVPQSTYNGWENNPGSIKTRDVYRICKALNVRPSEIIFFESESQFSYDFEEVK